MKKGRNALTAVILCALLTFLSVITCMAEDPSISEKENNNTWDTANSIIPGVPVTGSLDSLEDVDCYRFAVASAGYVDLQFAHEEAEASAWEILLYRVGSGVERVASFESEGGNTEVLSWRTGIDEGVYILWISPGFDSSSDIVGRIYQFSIRFTEDAYWESAGSSSPSEAKHMAFGAVYGGTITDYGDQDYFKLTVPQDGYLELLFEHDLTASARWTVTLYRGETDLEKVYAWESSGQETSSRTMKIAADSGTYYVKISPGTVLYSGIYNKIYRLSAQFTANEHWENTWNQSFVNARTVQIGEWYGGNLSSAADLDYFVLHIERTARVRLYMDSPDAEGGWRISLCRFDKEMQALVTHTVTHDENRSGEVWCRIEPGVYYILIENLTHGNTDICGVDYSFCIEGDLPFEDVPACAWYRPYVEYVTAKGLFLGTGGDNFSPETSMTRAMFVQLFANLDGVSLDQYEEQPFTDVEMTSWYGPAIAWASEYRLVLGTSPDTFEPNAEITREQMCQLLVNYIDYAGIHLNTSGVYKSFADADTISDWARNAVEICVRAGLISGKGDGRLDPLGKASRAEVATLLTNFCERTAS